MSTTSQGWQCPCCETVYAPHISSCKCKKVKSLKPRSEPLTPAEEHEMRIKLREQYAECLKRLSEKQSNPPYTLGSSSYHLRKSKDSIKQNPILQWKPRPFIEVHLPEVPGLVFWQANDVIKDK